MAEYIVSTNNWAAYVNFSWCYRVQGFENSTANEYFLINVYKGI